MCVCMKFFLVQIEWKKQIEKNRIPWKKSSLSRKKRLECVNVRKTERSIIFD